jgi:16S rRNA (adenine1518-N6/adenine1519-N6)-dimethyltransferase
VAQRIVSQAGTKAYGRLAVISQWRTVPRVVMTLGPEAFTPPPAVASAVVEFVPRARPEPSCSVRTLGRVTAAAFGQRRKMLRQSLKGLDLEPAELLQAAGIDPEQRAEQLAVSDFAQLAQVLDNAAGKR